MKIKKLVESKKLIEAEGEEENTEIEANASTSEIASDIKDAVNELTDGEKEISDGGAAKAAEMTQDAAEVTGAKKAVIVIDKADWNDIKITSSLYEALDESYEAALDNMGKHTVESNANILVEGLPGSGKTAAVNAWCKMNGLTMVKINATDPKIEAAINGLPLRDLQAAGENENKLTYAYAIDDKTGVGLLLNDLHPNLAKQCVLFVDEFNRQMTSQLRKPFMEVFNAKKNANGTLDFTKNLLFSVVAINPFGNDFHDKGVAELNSAELDRFYDQIRDYDSNIPAARSFWEWFRASELLKLGIISPGSEASKNHGGWVGPTVDLDAEDINWAKRVIKASTLALYILNNVDKSNETEVFTTRKDTDKAYRSGNLHLTTQRGLFEGIMNNTRGNDKSPVDKFLKWVDNGSKYTQEKIQMFHDILDDYVMDVQGLFNAYNIDKTPEEIEAIRNGKATASKAPSAAPEAEQEDDDEMFTADELGSVSSASSDELSKDDVDSILNSW